VLRFYFLFRSFKSVIPKSDFLFLLKEKYLTKLSMCIFLSKKGKFDPEWKTKSLDSVLQIIIITEVTIL